MRRDWVWPRGASYLPAAGTVLQGGLILVSLVRVERLDEDADRINVCLFRARKFTSLGTRR